MSQEERKKKRQKRTADRFRNLYIIGLVGILLIIGFGMIIVGLLNEISMAQTDGNNQVMELRQDIENPPEPQIEAHTGTFTVTHYCLENYPHICNDGDSTQTASGETPIPYYTIAADESIPFGTMMEIDGQKYEVMDRGGSIRGNRIDIAVPTHAEALSRGKFERTVRYEIPMP